MVAPIIIAAMIAGGATIAGGAMANRASAKQAAGQMAFQDQLSRTAHQREVEDLRAAGLNPILSGTGGRGASTPPGAQAPQRNIMEGAAQTALSVVRQKQELKNMRATKSAIEAQEAVSWEQMGKLMSESHSAEMQARVAEMDWKVRKRNQAGDMDAAAFWSHSSYGIKRRADAALETARKLIPFTTPGQRSPRSKHQ